jgi:hypothetical protein
MGNHPSTPKPSTTPTSSSSPYDSPRISKKEPKTGLNPLHHQQHRSAASPEASDVQAQGSTISNRDSQSRPLSIFNPSSPSGSSSSHQHHAYQQQQQQQQQPPWASDYYSPTSSLRSRQQQTDPSTKQQQQPPHSQHDYEQSQPVDVPAVHPDSSSFRDSQYEESSLSAVPTSNSIQDLSYAMARPPRLPLPIEEEIHTPGSPIFAPTDTAADVPALDDHGSLPRRTSGLSNATDEDDSEELRVDKTRPTVPTKVEWHHGGQKVYVTGTPFQWSRKQRLVPSKDQEGVLETVIPVFPGTHHIKFLVDGSMQTSHRLPTTVDFGNNLVNYIEVSGEEAAVRNVNLDTVAPKSAKEAEALPSRQTSADDIDGEAKVPQKKVIVPVETFSDKIPDYLADFDQPEERPPYKLAAFALDKLPTPPSLPGFLSKPILNNTTLIKDDNSVLNMPNHTVLNHLGTSSIKNNVLAVSATTRYRNKYVTTIIYKPTTE